MPYVGDLNYFGFADFRTHSSYGSALFAAGSEGWGVVSPDSVTLKYQSWTNNQIIISGFSGTYGQDNATVENGDPILITLWSTGASSYTGPQTMWGGFVSTTANTTLYAVTFTESGLPTGTSWSVTFNGQTESSTGSSITFSGIPPGNYTYTVTPPQGFVASPSSGSLSVSTSNVIEPITFLSPSVQVVNPATYTSQPFWNNEFTLVITLANTGSEPISNLPGLTGSPTFPTTDATGSTPTFTCSPPVGPQSIMPGAQAEIRYNCIAQWNIMAPPSLLSAAIGAYESLAIKALTNTKLINVATKLIKNPQLLSIFQTEAQLGNVAGKTINGLQDTQAAFSVIQMVEGNEVTLGVTTSYISCPHIPSKAILVLSEF